jgi:inosose dehydratase
VTAIRIGNAPCSWGSLEFEGLEAEPIGCDQMLDELIETGYAGTELGDWGFMPTEPEALRETLARRKLTMLGAFVPVAFGDRNAHAAGQENALSVARLLASVKDTGGSPFDPFVVLADENGTVGERTANAGRVCSEMKLSGEAWGVFARGVERVGRAVREEAGLRCVFHHHCAGYVETPDEIARLLDLTDPELVGLVFDTGHYAFGSGRPSAECVQDGLDRFGHRVRYVHFKDCDPAVAAKAGVEGWDYFQSVAGGVFCELGRGCVDFAQAKEWLAATGYQGWICVEQDVLPGMGRPKESARRNREYLRSIGL